MNVCRDLGAAIEDVNALDRSPDRKLNRLIKAALLDLYTSARACVAGDFKSADDYFTQGNSRYDKATIRLMKLDDKYS